MPLVFVDPRRPSIDALDARQSAQLGAIEVLVRGGEPWDGRFLAVPFEGEYAATQWRVVRGDQHAYDAWIYGGGHLVVFAAGDARPVAWDYEGLDGVDDIELDEIDAAVPRERVAAPALTRTAGTSE